MSGIPCDTSVLAEIEKLRLAFEAQLQDVTASTQRMEASLSKWLAAGHDQGVQPGVSAPHCSQSCVRSDASKKEDKTFSPCARPRNIAHAATSRELDIRERASDVAKHVIETNVPTSEGLNTQERIPEAASHDNETQNPGEDLRSEWTSKYACAKKKSTGTLSLFEVKLYERIRKSWWYENLVLLIIASNAAFIGLEVQWNAIAEESLPWSVEVELFFCLLFSLEICFRICGERCHFFYSKEWRWNYFELFLVFSGLVDQLFILADAGMGGWLSEVSVLRVLRVVRIVRMIRIIRTVRFFRDLRLIIYSIAACLRSLLWVMCVLAMFFYIFGLAITQGTTDYFRDPNHDVIVDLDVSSLLRKYFGSLDRSMLSLYGAMSGGISWGELLDVLAPLPGQYSVMFLLFVSGSIYAVANVVTGVFVENAVQNGQKDKESLIEDEMEAKEHYSKLAHDFFLELDSDNSGTISFEEFESAVQNDVVIAYFRAMQLEVRDVRVLFELLDPRCTGVVGIQDFLAGCTRLKGEARSMDIAKLQLESEHILRAIRQSQEQVIEVHKRLDGIGNAHQQLEAVCHRLEGLGVAHDQVQALNSPSKTSLAGLLHQATVLTQADSTREQRLRMLDTKL